MPSKDPFSQCYESVWDCLEANADFAALVPARCRVKYVDDGATAASRAPERDARQPLEYPQVAVEPATGESIMFRTSDGTHIREDFQIEILTGDKRLCYLQGSRYQGINPVRMAIFTAMMDWESYLGSLTWNGMKLAYDCRITQHQAKQGSNRLDEQNAPPRNAGWIVAWRGSIEMWLDSADLLSQI